MVKKLNKLPPELSKELKGFEDIFEDYLEDEADKERVRSNKEFQKNTETYELQNFLEEENSRLTSMEQFFTKKLPAQINFSQTERLIVEQIKRKNLLRERINEETVKENSILFKNLSTMFNAHFS